MIPTTPKLAALGAVLTGLALGAQAEAQSADALLDKLVQKGILTVDEASELREEADRKDTTAYRVKRGMPEWVTALEVGGDLRGRFEGFYSDNPLFVDVNRFRYRLRIGVTAVLLDDFEIGVRLGSGDLEGVDDLRTGVDPITNNQTLKNNASKKGVFLDLVYAKWSPLHTADWNGNLTLGKMHNPFVLSDMVFDHDYTPEGAGLEVGHRLADAHTIRLNAGAFVLDEIGSSSHDPHLLGAQVRADSRWNQKLTTSVGVASFVIGEPQNLKTSDVPDSNVGNSRDTNGVLQVHFNPIHVDASMAYVLDHLPWSSAPFPITLEGEYLYNPAADDRNQAYSVGVTFGKAGKKGLWDVSYRWRCLEADAWYEELPDSDFGAYYAAAPPGGTSGYGAGTNVRGHIVQARYSPYDFLTLSIQAYIAELIDEPSPPAEDPGRDMASDLVRLQVDAAWRF